MIDQPSFVRLEYWNSSTGEWEVGHAGINLMNPAAYVRKMGQNNTLVRAVEVDTGVTAYGTEGADLL